MSMRSLNPSLKTCRETSQNTLVLPAGRLNWPWLFEPRNMPGDGPDKKPKYSTSIMFPRDVDFSLLHTKVDACAVEKWGTKPIRMLKKPLLDNRDKDPDPDRGAAFPHLIRCSHELAPRVLYGNLTECDQPAEVYGGRWAMVSVRVFAWEHPTGGKGVSLGLGNVLLLDHDERIGVSRPDPLAEFKGLGDPNMGPGDPRGAFDRARGNTEPYQAEDLLN